MKMFDISFNRDVFIITFIILRSTPVVKIEDATLIQRCDRKRRFIAEKTSALKQSRDIQMFLLMIYDGNYMLTGILVKTV